MPVATPTNDSYSVAAGTTVVQLGVAAAAPALNISGTAYTPNRDGGGNVLASDWTQLPVLGGWLEVQGTAALLATVVETPHYVNSGGGDDLAGLVDAWTSMGWDRANGLGYQWAQGGHSDTRNNNNAAYQLTLGSLTWSRIKGRTTEANIQGWNGTALVASQISYPGNVPQLDGVPGAVHGYNALVWLPPGTPGAGAVKGGLHLGSFTRATLNLDTGAVTTPHWYTPNTSGVVDWSYAAAVLDGSVLFQPRNSFAIAKFDLAGTQATSWSATSSGVLTPSYAAASVNFVYNHRCFVDLDGRREYVSFSGASGAPAVRVRFGAARDAGGTDWSAYHDTITLASANGTDHLDFSTANLADTGATNMLCGAGADYDHATATIWVQCNNVGDSLYRITGIAGNAWTVYKVPGSGATRQTKVGGYNRLRHGRQAGVQVLVRHSGTSHPLQIIRVG